MSSSQQNQQPAYSMTRTAAGTGELDPRMPPDKEMEHLWRYFSLHAQQRISVFNFFVVFSGVIATGIGGALQAGRPMTFLVFILGLLLVLLSFVFFRLDQRNSDLIKLSERGLRASENTYLPDYAQIFEREANAGPGSVVPGDRKKQTVWTFGRSFRFLFAMMGTMGFVASSYSIYQWYQLPTANIKQTQKLQTSSETNETPPAVELGSSGQPPRQVEQAPAGHPVGKEDPRANSAPATKKVPGAEKSEAPKN